MKDPLRRQKKRTGKKLSPCCNAPFKFVPVRCSKCDSRFALSGPLSDLEVYIEEEDNEETVESTA